MALYGHMTNNESGHSAGNGAPRAQRYTSTIARDHMSRGRCPECGNMPEAHSSAPQFWLRPGGCDLLPQGVADRIAAYEWDTSATLPGRVR